MAAYPAQYPTQYPMVQQMDLANLPGVFIRQQAQVAEAVLAALGAPFEQANGYDVLELPPGAHVATKQGDEAAWLPSQEEAQRIPQVMFVKEESDCVTRLLLAAVGGLNLRPMKLWFYAPGGPRYVVERPCRLGACCCCPMEMTLRDSRDGAELGKVVEDDDSYCRGCWDCCCCCTYTFKILEVEGASTWGLAPRPATRPGLVHKYSLRVNACCCGAHNNCCGATCCKPNFIMDVLDPSGRVESNIVNTYGAGGCADCLRCSALFNNYLVPFPKEASSISRALLVSSAILVDYLLFEKKGGDSSGD